MLRSWTVPAGFNPSMRGVGQLAVDVAFELRVESFRPR